ncbi:MAG TPA: serine/threonine-protein kinase [Bryobacteraceae bacterium]|nr:serine/threonine-protein kinase [Bryobacteraceae bacterium]
MSSRLEQLFALAVEQPVHLQEEFLLRECAGDSGLLTRLRCLLESDRTAAVADFWNLSQPPCATDPWIGRTVGAWRIVDTIGKGGMGTVYRAVRADSEYEQFAAIKLVTGGGLDTDLLIARFRAERQILARLVHPNIGRLLDGGTVPGGLPYLVMEYIDGEPLNEYCEGRQLDERARLRLFLDICSAVHFAHQHLVIHRDLKPGNILVTASGEPKLLDFGIAKLIMPEPVAYASDTPTIGLPLMTPRYASPEQVRGEAITTASDVYSLGVVLYELIAGVSPYGQTTASTMDVLRAVCDEDPQPPSVAAGKAGGDIDNIVLMALRKDPARRYASVEQFAEDIRRYLDGAPVIAHQDTLQYRAGKFLRRHTMGVIATALMLVLLSAGVAGIAWQSHLAQVQKQRAERRFDDVRRLANYFLFDFHDAIQNVPGTLAARQLLVKRSEEYLDSLAREAADDHNLESELAAAYTRVGTLTFDVPLALESHRKALSIMQRLVRAEPQNAHYREQLASCYSMVASLLRESGDSLGALENARQATLTLEDLVKSDPNNRYDRDQLAYSYMETGRLLARVGRSAEALTLHRKALQSTTTLLALEPHNREYERAVMVSSLFLARTLEAAADYKAALAQSQSALRTAESLSRSDPSSSVYQRDVWIGHLRVAQADAKTGDLAAALSQYLSALPYIEHLAAADKGDRGHWHGVALTYLGIANVLADRRRFREARVNYGKAVAIAEDLISKDPNKTEARIDLASIYTKFGTALLQAGDRSQASRLLKRARTLFEDAARKDPANVEIARARAELPSVPPASE